MSSAIDEARIESARMILAECRGRITHAIRQEIAKGLSDSERANGLRAIQKQLREESLAVIRGDEKTIARVRFLYGLLLKQMRAPISG